MVVWSDGVDVSPTFTELPAIQLLGKALDLLTEASLLRVPLDALGVGALPGLPSLLPKPCVLAFERAHLIAQRLRP